MADVIQMPDGSKMQVPANVGSVCPPTKDMLDPAQYAVNMPGKLERISWPLFSYQAYAAGGPAAPLVFFQTPVGGAVTVEDTNMELAAQLPAPQRFLITGVSVDFISGNAVSKFGAETANGNLNDYYAVMKRGFLTVKIGAKIYINGTSLLQFPMRSHIGGVAAVADGLGVVSVSQTMIQAGFSEGDVYKPIPLLLEPSQNFKATIEWGAASPAIPSADAAARIGVVFWGTLFRAVQ